MLFNSSEFIFLFLPAALAIFTLLGIRGFRAAGVGWLVAASLFFYGWWNPPYLLLLLGSIFFNYCAGRALAREGNTTGGMGRRGLLVLGMAVNLGALGYFKYAGFFVENLNAFFGTGYETGSIILPLAISFFTFQQITFLVDSYYHKTEEHNFLHYCLFVTFFPQLIAGPIVHHSEMLPQFRRDAVYRFHGEKIARGMTFFVFGLFKKVVLADGVAVYAGKAFAAASSGKALAFGEAWMGSLSYTFQLYFDFSGYSDMAVGLAFLFGIRLPFNFNSPYKAESIIDFWRRWHITLSRFLRDYIYIPLGGNRKGSARSDVNMLVTVVLGGVWHGAGWTFLAWGLAHGLFLLVNRWWRRLGKAVGRVGTPGPLGRLAARVTTFVAVSIAWVLFRAESFDAAGLMLRSMAGFEGFVFSAGLFPLREGRLLLAVLAVMFVVVAFFRNTQEYIDGAGEPVTDAWRPRRGMALLVGTMIFCVLLALITEAPSEFLYFQF